MTDDGRDYFLFVGTADSEAATTRLRASGAIYRKKLLSSKPDNWLEIVDMVTAASNRGTLVNLTGADYASMCSPMYREVTSLFLDSLAHRPHVIFVHEAVFLTAEQRAAEDSEHVDMANLVDVTPRFDHEDYFGMTKEEFFGTIPDELRQRVNTSLRDRELNVVPYRTNVERSIIASGFLEDHERHLLFRIYVPSGRLYAQEADTLLGLFREWLGQMGRPGIRQEGYSTNAGQVFEFFSGEDEPEGGLARYFEDFSSFLDRCMSAPEIAVDQLAAIGVDASVAERIVSRFATQARRLTLDLKQRREERLLSLKHQLENVMLEIDGIQGDHLDAVIDQLLPPSSAGAAIQTPTTSTATSTIVNNYNPQFIHEVVGPVIQSVAGTVNLGPEAHQLLELIAAYGGNERGALETALHEIEDEGARGGDRIAARGRIKRFLADLGNRGLGVGVNVLQKYVEHKVGVS